MIIIKSAQNDPLLTVYTNQDTVEPLDTSALTYEKFEIRAIAWSNFCLDVWGHIWDTSQQPVRMVIKVMKIKLSKKLKKRLAILG